MGASPRRLRVVTKDDIPDLLIIAHKVYGDAFDAGNAARWAQAVIGDKNGIFLRTDHAFGVAACTSFFWRPNEKLARLVFLASCSPNPMDLEGFRILQDLVVWAKNVGATSFSLGSETGVDFAPFADRLNACKDTPSYTISLGGKA